MKDDYKYLIGIDSYFLKYFTNDTNIVKNYSLRT